MEKTNFPNPKLNLPKQWKEDVQRQGSFNAIENYLDLVSEYIYTEISHTNTNHNTYAWILKLVSESLLRSMYLRNSCVDSINTRNYPSLFLSIKAWWEVIGLLSLILNTIKNQNISESDLMIKVERLALGNRGESDSRVGTVDSISVMTMLDSANKYLKDTSGYSEDFFRYFYDIASNPSHPTFDAHALVGGLKNEIWVAKDSDCIKKAMVDELDSFGGLFMAPLHISMICDDIFCIEKIKQVTKKSQKYLT